MTLCWMCREFYEKRHIEVWPDDHCHHEEPEEKPVKSKCWWCEHWERIKHNCSNWRITISELIGLDKENPTCPICGKKL